MAVCLLRYSLFMMHPYLKQMRQVHNFCVVLTQLVNDASGDFSRAKGKEIEVHSDISIWTTNMGLPGMVTSSLLFTTSWQYEGVIYQGSSVKDMQTYYDRYKKLLEGCLPVKGYFLSSEANTEPQSWKATLGFIIRDTRR